jgi:hypothetical protein
VERIDLDVELAESLGGVVLLLRRAGMLAWAWAEAEGVSSYHNFIALAIDEVADQTAYLLPGRTILHGPGPLSDSVPALLESARELVGLVTADKAHPVLRLGAAIGDLVRDVADFDPAGHRSRP